MIALSGISCALALISVVGSMFVEFMTLTFAVLAAVFVSMPFTQKYWVGGIISYVATSIFAFLIGNINALPFILFFGAYAVVQWGIEQKLYPLIKNKILRYSVGYTIKLAYFEAIIAIFWFLFNSLIPTLTIFGKAIKLTYIIIALAGIPLFLLYDVMMHLLFKNFAVLINRIISKTSRTTTPDDIMYNENDVAKKSEDSESGFSVDDIFDLQFKRENNQDVGDDQVTVDDVEKSNANDDKEKEQ